MGIFDRNNRQAPMASPPTASAEYTIEKLQQRLDVFGLQRMSITDPDIKMMISRAVWSAVPYVQRISGGAPKGSDLVDPISEVNMLIQLMEQYLAVQRSGRTDAEAQDLLSRGHNAVKAWLAKLDPDALHMDKTMYKAVSSVLTDTGV